MLERDGGALPKMLPPFWFGVGGKVGSGRQYWPWIHRADWISLVRWTIASATATGAFNVTAPNAGDERRVRAGARPRAAPPGVHAGARFALRIVLGEMADALLLSGQRAVPAKAEALGFSSATSIDDRAAGDL